MKTLALIDAELVCLNIFLERKKNRQIKGLISNMWLILLYTEQLVIPDVCTKFQKPRLIYCEILEENFHIHYIGVRDRKRKNRRKK